jgi:pimeloyl-ACP methyl ester carboxylesterase
MPAMPTVPVRGRKVYYEIHGDAVGVPPLLLLMGMGGSCRGWLPLQVPEFQKSRRTILVDHRGVGGSEDPGSPFGTADLADDAAALLDALHVERADALGVFMGGMVAQQLALRHAARVDRLVLVGTWARPDAKRRLLLEHWRDLARADAPLLAIVRERLLWTLADETLEQQDLIDAMVTFFTHDEPPLTADVFARQCEACLAHDALARLGRISAPVLAIAGDRDILTPVELQRAFASRIPGSRLVCLRGVGHVVAFEAAQRFNRLVRRFMLEVEGVDPAVWDRRSA